MQGVVVDSYRKLRSGLLEDKEIARLAVDENMLTPFHCDGSPKGAVSYGLSSCGYDSILANEFRVFKNTDSSLVIDPKNFSEDLYDSVVTDVLVLPPHSFALARTVEYFKMPRDVSAICLGKSTYARCGLIVNVTPLEPEWEGHVTLELSNTTSLPVRVYANEGICQFLFFRLSSDCMTSYADKRGKYQKQTGITNAKVS